MAVHDTDRELLELAAKAAGYTGRVEYSGATGECCFAFDMDTARRTGRLVWAPHEDDGDGARLEAALGIDVEWHNVGVRCAKLTGASRDDIVARETYADHGGDKQAARRLASLRVATEIGRAMP